MDILQYTIGNVSFQCALRPETRYPRVYFNEEYYALALEKRDTELHDIFLKRKMRKAPYFYMDTNEADIGGGQIDYMIGLFRSNGLDSTRDNDLRRLTYHQKLDTIVGYAALATHIDDKKAAVLYGNVINPAHRGQKLSRMLCQARLDYAIENKFKTVITKVHALNQASIAALDPFGFKRHDTHHDANPSDFLTYSLDLKDYKRELRQNILKL